MSLARQNLRLVLVENDQDDCFFLQRALVKEGFACPYVHLRDGYEAMNYFTALEASGEPLPDVVLTDLKMPRMDGIDLLGWLRARSRFVKLPVIVLTSSNEPSDMRRTGSLGIFKFITKRVRYENLTAALKLFCVGANGPGSQAHA